MTLDFIYNCICGTLRLLCGRVDPLCFENTIWICTMHRRILSATVNFYVPQQNRCEMDMRATHVIACGERIKISPET